jgi:AcrR family transcriptional regulator
MSSRDHILQVASDLFYREGIRAVGIDRVIAVSGVAKATLYRQFSSKEQLVTSYLTDRHERVIGALKQALEDEPMAARHRIRRIFEILRNKAETEPFRGCAFLIAVAETEGVAQIRDIARDHKQALRLIFDQATRELTPDHQRLSEEIALCYEGALASIALQRTAAPVEIALRCVEALIDAAPPLRGRRRSRPRDGRPETPPTQPETGTIGNRGDPPAADGSQPS